MTPITDLIRELRELEAKATKGPWTIRPFNKDGYCVDSMEGPGGSPVFGCYGNYEESAPCDQDTALIVAMRNALPRILDRLEKLERVAEAARKLHAECPYEADHSGRCDRNTDNRTTKPCECGTNDWVAADEALGDALAAL